jgi:hypothetical protein
MALSKVRAFFFPVVLNSVLFGFLPNILSHGGKMTEDQIQVNAAT